ncbi:ECF transporter S component [Actinoplanes sp. NPDC023801]|uniref:ECF transporter S component n=1 Tax=Actinoplanes sp. NPDC023801 TaxID=3154595 RepID=UPI0033F28B31
MIALAVLRRPGVALVTMFLAGIIAVASPAGPSAIVTNLMVGAALEAGFLITRYWIWRPWLFFLTGALFQLYYAPASFAFYNIGDMALAAQIAFVGLLFVSTAAFTQIGLVVAKRLTAAGVARGIAPVPMSAAR